MNDENNYLLEVKVFCTRNCISKALFYKLLKQGAGPQITKIGSRTLIRPEAETDWRNKMEQHTAHLAA